MKKLASLLIVGILMVALAIPASAVSICPFDDEPTEELVPSHVTTTATVAGVCEGSTMFTESNAWILIGNVSGVSSVSTDLLTGIGVTTLAAETTQTTLGPTSTTASLKTIDYQGSGAVLSDTVYMNRVNNGGDGDPGLLCEDVIGGGTVMFSSGAYGSELTGLVSPGSGIRVTYQNAGGPSQAAQPAPTAMIGTMTSFGMTHAIYGGLSGDGVAVPELETSHETRATMSGKLNMMFSFEYDSFAAT